VFGISIEMKMYAELARNCKSHWIKSRWDNTKLYLTGDYKTAFNDGKIDEVGDRVKHIKQF
jgi:hypothetical protein